MILIHHNHFGRPSKRLFTKTAAQTCCKKEFDSPKILLFVISTLADQSSKNWSDTMQLKLPLYRMSHAWDVSERKKSIFSACHGCIFFHSSCECSRATSAVGAIRIWVTGVKQVSASLSPVTASLHFCCVMLPPEGYMPPQQEGWKT